MNNRAPFLARFAYSDRVANAPMLHEIILEFDTIFDANHRNSLFARQVSAITFCAQGWDYFSTQIYFGKKWYAYHHDEDIWSALYLRAAASTDRYGR